MKRAQGPLFLLLACTLTGCRGPSREVTQEIAGDVAEGTAKFIVEDVIIEGLIEPALDAAAYKIKDALHESGEERELRKERERLAAGKPLRYHVDEKDLKEHEERLERKKQAKWERREWEKTKKGKEWSAEVDRLKKENKKRIARSNFRRIKPRMTKEQVVALVGQPKTKEEDFWIYTLSEYTEKNISNVTTIEVNFSEGKVVSMKKRARYVLVD